MNRRAVALGVLLAAACATPESRIKRRPEVFASFPPEAQARIKEGKIDLGFTSAMVEMALGRPDRKYERRTPEGPVEVWGYGTASRGGPRMGVGADVIFGGGRGGVFGMGGVGVGSRAGEADTRRVLFRDGKVIGIEEPR